MPERSGTPATAKDPPHAASQDKVLHPFDRPGTDSGRDLEIDSDTDLSDTDLQSGVREKRRLRLAALKKAWPLILGLALAACAPALRAYLSQFDPWVTRLVFPFVLLAGRPEISLGTAFSRLAPPFVLFFQFPLEGLLVYFDLKHQIRLGSAIGQLAFLHLAGAFILFLLAQPSLP